MTGAMVQVDNLESGNNKLGSVLSGGIDDKGNAIKGIEDFLNEFKEYLPLHHADLSGYGLSTFSDWHRDVPSGVIKVRFEVLTGRTSYEVIQVKTILAFPMCYAVRTIIMERRNSGKVLRFAITIALTENRAVSASVVYLFVLSSLQVALVAKHCRRLRVALLLGNHCRGLSLVVREGDVGATFKEKFNHRVIPVLRCGVDRRPSVLLASIDRSAVLEQ